MKILKKIIEYGIYLIAFLLPIQTRLILRAGEIDSEYLEYLTISLYGIDLLILGVLLLYCFFVLKNRVSIKTLPRIKKIWWIVGILDLFIFASIFFAADKLLATYHYSIFLLGISLFWLILSASYSKMKLLWGFLAGITLQSGLGIYQFLSQSSFACKYLGIASRNPGDLGVSVVEFIASDGVGERWLRAYGGLDHPNILGGVLTVGLLFLTVLICRFYLKEKKNQTFLLFTFYFLFLTSLFFTFSRAAYLSFFIGLCLIFVGTIFLKNKKILKRFLGLMTISFILVLILFSQFGEIARARFIAQERLELKSKAERIEYLGEAKEVIKNNLFFGAGIGNYILAFRNQEQDKADNYLEKAKKQAWAYQPVHNVFLLVWAEIGLFGLLGFLVFLGYLGYLSFWQFRKKENLFSLPMLLSLIIIMMFDHWLWSLHFGVLFFWLVMGILSRDKKI